MHPLEWPRTRFKTVEGDVEELYDKENKPLDDEISLEESAEEDVQRPALLFSEFEVALNELKNWTAYLEIC